MNQAITIFIVGMISVFTVLSLVVLTGNVLVNIVNRLHRPPVIDYPINEPVLTNEVIPKEEIAAITAAVQILTQGKGKITTIKKM